MTKKVITLLAFILISILSEAFAGPRDALTFYHKMMNPKICPTWTLYEIGETHPGLFESELVVFEHFLANVSGTEQELSEYASMFDGFSSDNNPDKSPCFFLIWLRSKYPYERSIKVARYEFLPNKEDDWPTYKYILKSKTNEWIIHELGNGRLQYLFRKIDFAYINGKDIGEEYEKDIEAGKVDLLIKDYFLGRKTYLQNCFIRK